MIKKDFRHDYYSGIKGIYFYKIIETIVEIGNLKKPGIKILDFGAGVGKLKMLLGSSVDNYDVIPELSEIKDWRQKKYDFVVANEVFELFSILQLKKFISDLERSNPQAKLIVGISKQGIINNILSVLGGEPDAHVDTITFPKDQIRILTRSMKILDMKTVLGLSDVYLLELRK